MKKLNRWLIASLTIGLLGGVVGVPFLTKKPEAVKAGTSTDQAYTCRVVKNSNIETLPTTMFAYYWSASTDPSGELAAVTTVMTFDNSTTYETDGYASFSLSFAKTYANVIFKTHSDWSGTQSIDLQTDYPQAIASTYGVVYEITAFYTGKYTGSWNAKSFPSFSSSYLRVWGDPSGSDYSGTGYLWVVHYWNDALTIDHEIPAKGFANASSADRWLGYFDIPTEIIGCHRQAKVYLESGNYVSATAPDDTAGTGYKTYVSGDNAQVYYFNEGTQPTLSQGIVGDASQAVPVAILSDVFGGYLTCSSDLDNGYGKMNQLVLTWLHNADSSVWWINGNMTDITLDDFATGDDAKYATGADRNVSTTVQAKYDRMLALYTNSHSGGAFRFFNESGEKNNSVLIVCLSLAAASLAVGAYFLRKKRTSALR
jgi:hypothetical protein